MCHICLLTKHTACFELAEGESLTNPIETWYCVTPKNSIHEKNVVADILAMLPYMAASNYNSHTKSNELQQMSKLLTQDPNVQKRITSNPKKYLPVGRLFM